MVLNVALRCALSISEDELKTPGPVTSISRLEIKTAGSWSFSLPSGTLIIRRLERPILEVIYSFQ